MSFLSFYFLDLMFLSCFYNNIIGAKAVSFDSLVYFHVFVDGVQNILTIYCVYNCHFCIIHSFS
ncbi:hypothetical protein MCHI_000306 [Candidatus Magnetoovum chiemensis]|nr:hypothetical protein MCHI_000306 [Candidatus Magnetoovum chiemensis]